MLKNRMNVFLLVGAVFSLGIIVVGYFLWTILIPIQDIDTMSNAELYRTQQELALNYPLGRFMLYAGFISLGMFMSILIGRIIYKKWLTK